MSNSLVAQEGTVDELKVRHSGDAVHKVIEGTYSVLETPTAALEAPRQWSKIELEQPERVAFAEAARVLRLPAPEASPIAAEQFLTPRRRDDEGRDLWRTFNCVQENTLRGGLHGIGRDANNQRRRVSTREVKGIDQSVALNRALFTLVAEMAKLKTGRSL